MVKELKRIHALSNSFVPLDWKGRPANESSTALDIPSSCRPSPGQAGVSYPRNTTYKTTREMHGWKAVTSGIVWPRPVWAASEVCVYNLRSEKNGRVSVGGLETIITLYLRTPCISLLISVEYVFAEVAGPVWRDLPSMLL